MKFKSVKEMEMELVKVTSLEALKEDIIFISQGNTIVLKPEVPVPTEIVWVGGIVTGKQIGRAHV